MAKTTGHRYSPDRVSPPGETLQETISALNMPQRELAERMGRPVKTINEIIKGKAAITPDTALQLEKVLNIPARFWLNREQQYRESLARKKDYETLQQQTELLKIVPVQEMTKRGWIDRYDDAVMQLHAVLHFFGVVSFQQWEQIWYKRKVAFRKSLTFASHPGALAAWLRKGELEAQAIQCSPFDEQAFRSALSKIRTLTTKPPEVFEPQMRSLCAQAGVAVVLVPQLADSRVSGATLWLAPSKALIQLSLRYKSDDHFWFSFFHEAAHILLHGKRDVFLEGSGHEDTLSKEDEANQFARNFLIRPHDYQNFLKNNAPPYISKKAILSFAKTQGIAPGIVVGRLQHDKHIPFSHCNDLKRKLDWAADRPDS